MVFGGVLGDGVGNVLGGVFGNGLAMYLVILTGDAYWSCVWYCW